MQFTMFDIEKTLGKSFNKYSEFCLETFESANNKEIAGFVRIKEIINNSGDIVETMILMGKPIKKPNLFDRITRHKDK